MLLIGWSWLAVRLISKRLTWKMTSALLHTPTLLRRRRSLGLASQPAILGQLRPLGSIFGGNHRIIVGQPPFEPVLIRRHLMIGRNVPLEHLEAAAAI